MIKSELIARIAEQNPHLYARDIEALVRVILDRISDALADGGRVELRDFGTFSTRDIEARPGRNPRTGKVVEVQAKRNVSFRPGKAMRVRLNLKAPDLERETERLLRAS